MQKRKFEMQMSENFTFEEFTFSQTALNLGIDNIPNDKQLEAGKRLFLNVIQKVRNEFGPTVITSGYRCEELNDLIGGSPTSQHCKGEAADFKVRGVSNFEVAEWIRDNLEFDQLILEFPRKDDPNAGWIHCSFVLDKNRKSVLTALNKNGKTVYEEGLKLC